MARKHWGFDTRDMDASVRPQDDFYQHAHGAWLKSHAIPANESRWGSFTILRVETEKRLRKLVEGLKKGRYALHTPKRMIHDFYLSGLDEKRREKLGIAPVTPWIARIEKIRNKKDLLRLAADFHRIGVDVLWGGMVDQDSKNSERYILHLYQDGLGMPDRDYYLKDDAESKRVREAYIKHLGALHRLFGETAAKARGVTETIMRIETALAKASMRKEDTRDSEKVYHKLSVGRLSKLAPQIDWKQYLKDIGAGKVRELIVMQPDFIKSAGHLLDTVSIEDWKIYFAWHLLSDAAGALSKKYVREQFNFYGKVLSGSKKMKPVWRRALSATNGALGELVGKIYVQHYFTPEAKKRMNELVGDLFKAYEKRIRGLDWMSPATKKKALKKLRMMNHKIGYPDKWKSHKGIVIRADDYFGNLLRTAEFEHRRQLKKLGRSIDRTEWFMCPQTVNAYFAPNMNEIVFPAAILQPPFFDLSADDAVNYGSIGSVIGHEITHGFDDQGSKFDGRGNMKSWWREADRKRFEKKAKLLEKQFDAYTVADGIKVNGKLTLGENIADLGGASIAFDAYEAYLSRTREREIIDGFTPEQRFFLGFALFERELVRPESEKTSVLTDPHSPGQFRINGPVSNLSEFYAAFGVKKGDKLYRGPNQRAKIW